MDGFVINQSKATGLGGAIFSEFRDNVQNKVTQINLENGTITQPMASAEGLPGRTADGIYMRETGETKETAETAEKRLVQGGKASGVDVVGRYLQGVVLSNLDTIHGIKMEGRSGAGSAITAYQVCNEIVPFSGATSCNLDHPDVVLQIKRCEIKNFKVGLDIFDSSRVEVGVSSISNSSQAGINLDDCVADVRSRDEITISSQSSCLGRIS